MHFIICGIPVAGKGKNAGDVVAKQYLETPVAQAMHTGPYEEFVRSYTILMEYIQSNEINVNMEAFEFYHTDPIMEPNVTRWQTLIAFPLK